MYAVRENGYRFAFNGMEKDDEVKGVGNSLDFGARIYDSRLGRWLSRDPFAEKYPWDSPYIFAGNNPIYFVDFEGKYKISALDQSKSKMFTSYLKNFIKNDVIGSKSIMTALAKYSQLSNDDIAKALTFNKGPTIKFVDNLPFNADGFYTGGKNGEILINQKLIDQLNSSSPEDKQAALLLITSTLLHETVHYGDWQDGSPDDNSEASFKEQVVNGEVVKVWYGDEKGRLFESDAYRNGEWDKTIENIDDAKNVILEKAQTPEGNSDLPTVPEVE